ncbi:MAG: deoxyribodipyrimidine photo-lyase [Haloarculaceae archaeon]
MHVFWHRRDLRAPDNRGLARAAARGPVCPVFVFDESVLAHAAPPRVAFLLDALASLRAWYRERGGDLHVAHGDPSAVLPELAAALDAEAVHWNDDYSGLARERDRAVTAALEADGVAVDAAGDALLHEPGSITPNEGDHYSVFSYFWTKWRDREKADPVEAPPADALVADAAAGAADPLPSLADLSVAEPACSVPAAGTAAARERLAAFLDGPVYDYEERRDYPADECTSRLSPHLRFGTVGVREVYAATARAMAAAPDADARSSVESFRRQLAWREFYAHVLRFDPRVVAANVRDYAEPIEWRSDPAGLQAWRDGETGYPLVDAGMRQLRREGHVHNRVRMVVASFLTKDLLVDWRRGYEWFRERLVDHDPANDSGGWQWAASTGADAQPYFRVFNPTTQCERYDPDAEYVREYVPELREATPDQVHDWPSLSPADRERVAPDYPAPIVDHAARREQAIDAFERARGED